MENKQIFIIDDSRIQLILLEKVLQNAGFTVSVFTNGNNLIDKLESEQPDLVISDIDMPVLDGFELIEEIQQQFGGVEFPFFFISASWNATIESRAETLGADLLIEKPFKFEALLDQIQKIFEPLPKVSKSC